MTKEIEDDLIIKTIDVSKMPNRNLFENKLKKETDIKKHFEFLIANHTERSQTPIFTILRELKKEVYKIAISYSNKDKGVSSIKGICLRLYKSQSDSIISTISNNNKDPTPVLAENFISFDKLMSFRQKSRFTIRYPIIKIL